MDRLVAEVRKNRMVHTRRFHGNLADICRDLRETENRVEARVVRLSSKRRSAAK